MGRFTACWMNQEAPRLQAGEHPTPYTLHPTPYTLHPAPTGQGQKKGSRLYIDRRAKIKVVMSLPYYLQCHTSSVGDAWSKDLSLIGKMRDRCIDGSANQSVKRITYAT